MRIKTVPVRRIGMEGLKEEKRKLRKEILALRDALSEEEITERSRLIAKRFRTLSVFQNAKRILLYGSYLSEVSTGELIGDLLSEGEKEIFLPVVSGSDLIFYRILDRKELAPGYRGIPEPMVREEERRYLPGSSHEDTVVIVPGTVFDIHGGRIGYGGGFYDRFLENMKGVTTIGTAFDLQVTGKDLPGGDFDKKTDYVITEKRTFGPFVR